MVLGKQVNLKMSGEEVRLLPYTMYPKLQIIKVKLSEAKSLSRVRLFATPWSVVYHAPPTMGFSRQEYWLLLLTGISRVQLCATP